MLNLADPIDCRLLDDWQRDFPVVPRPFAELGLTLGLDEDEVITRLKALKTHARITRVGATCAPNTVSASTLAALAATVERDEMGPFVGAIPPDFTLNQLRADEPVTLSSFQGQKPVALVFGSYT